MDFTSSPTVHIFFGGEGGGGGGGGGGNIQSKLVTKAKSFKGKYGALLEFPEGRGIQTKETFHQRGLPIFRNNTILLFIAKGEVIPS